MVDVLVIGGGVVGTAVARELSKYELDIVLVEKNIEVGMGVSKANSGIVHAGYDCKVGTLKAKLNVRGNELYEELARDLDFAFRRNGAFILAFSESELPMLVDLKKQGEANGVPGLEILEREAVLELEPNLNPEVFAALYAPTSGIVFGPEVATALAENALHNGVEVQLETEVLGIERCSDKYVVKTNRGVLEAKVIINAAGLYSDVMHNFVHERPYEITPRKGEYFLLDRAAKSIVDKTIFQLPTEKGKGVLVLPTIHDNILVGPSSEFIDQKDDHSTNDLTLQGIREQVSKSVPNVPLDMTITTFTGLRAKEKSSEDFIIEEAVPGFINAVGIESPGLTAAPAIGEHIGQMVVSKLKPVKKTNFLTRRTVLPLFKTLPLEKQQALIKVNPAYGRIICRCEHITEGDIVNTINSPMGACSLDGLKFKSRAGSGRCQGGFCSPRLIEILAREKGITAEQVTKRGGKSFILGGSEHGN